MKLIVGLGNPGRQYAGTRHNVGFMTVDLLGEALGIPVGKNKEQALIGEGFLGGEKVVLVKPQTYMNLSGLAVGALVRWYKVNPEDMLVIYDDMDMELGRLRLRSQGSAGGHNGIKSLIGALGTEKFPRLKVGIGRPLIRGEVTGHVLTPFTTEEWEEIKPCLERAVEAVKVWIREGLEAAMNRFNG